nr:SOS response-associated peptidase family protein [Ensifer aridi]
MPEGLDPGLDERAEAWRSAAANAPCEGISANGMFKKACASPRCLVPIDGFFEREDYFSEQARTSGPLRSP